MISTEIYNLQAESLHWWFRSRRKLLSDTLNRYLTYGSAIPGMSKRWRDAEYPWDAKNTAFAHILEIGCGSGGNLDLLSHYGRTMGTDQSPEAIMLANADQPRRRAIGDDATRMKWNDESFHVVVAADVLEHIEDDRETMRECYRVLRPDGLLVATVPAMPSLWGPHDEQLGHWRRYTRMDLRRKAIHAGFKVEECRYTMGLLMPAIWAHRHLANAAFHRAGAYSNPAQRVPPRPVNAVMEAIMDVDRVLGSLGVRWALGVSLLLVARKTTTPAGS